MFVRRIYLPIAAAVAGAAVALAPSPGNAQCAACITSTLCGAIHDHGADSCYYQAGGECKEWGVCADCGHDNCEPTEPEAFLPVEGEVMLAATGAPVVRIGPRNVTFMQATERLWIVRSCAGELLYSAVVEEGVVRVLSQPKRADDGPFTLKGLALT